ncbi:RNase P subunit p30-domain-containing protein [Mycena rosella]|uniref:RNase P subunit p30-domain-containing protein n=1 Tax=Mycena rosella TaxID=1033263 RepID=A0AAD7DPP1_MYCRO|nr:RNase P subunit p30-domain-containing protein [Mycena rosella]
MFFDLNFPVHHPQQSSAQNASKKTKGKQPQQQIDVTYSAAQIGAIEARVDLLVHLGYTAIALNQTVQTAVVPKTHANILETLVAQLKPRPGIVLLKRLTIVLDQESEKGFGLTPANVAIFKPYDLIALVPTTQPTFSLACLTHSQPSALTAHIIALPLTLRLDFRMKHTLVRTALKNGAVFEINYVGALGGDHDAVLVDAGAAESGAAAKRNWWATAKEVTRVTKGKGLIVSGGVVAEADLRAPKDVANLITLLGLPQESSHSASTKIPKSLVLRAQTRQTYRAVFSEPVLVIPEGDPIPSQNTSGGSEKKRPREDEDAVTSQTGSVPQPDPAAEGSSRKKKRKKNNQNEKTV